MKVEAKRAAYKEPWFWVVFTPLIVVITVSLSFAVVAFMGADDRVYDDYYKHGRTINNRFESQKRAQALQLAATVQFDFDVSEVRLTLSGDQRPGELQLTLSHPAEARRDMAITLTRVAQDTYRGHLTQPFSGHWYLILSAGAGDDLWRITAEADFQRSTRVDFVPHL